MIKLTTKGRAPRLYDCFGERITAKEELKAMRRRVFDHMVDWDAIVKGGTAK